MHVQIQFKFIGWNFFKDIFFYKMLGKGTPNYLKSAQFVAKFAIHQRKPTVHCF